VAPVLLRAIPKGRASGRSGQGPIGTSCLFDASVARDQLLRVRIHAEQHSRASSSAQPSLALGFADPLALLGIMSCAGAEWLARGTIAAQCDGVKVPSSGGLCLV